MPNPKVGTVTMDVKEAVNAAKGGQVQFKAEKAGVVHAGVGKASFDEGKLAENIRAFVDAVSKAKPSGAKGTYMKKVSVCLDHGPRRLGRCDKRHRQLSPGGRAARLPRPVPASPAVSAAMQQF